MANSLLSLLILLSAIFFITAQQKGYGVGIFVAGLALNKTVVWTANRNITLVSDDSDSNLAQFPVDASDADSHPYWETGTSAENVVNVTRNLDPDGHLFLLNNSGTFVKKLTGGFSEEQRLYLMKIDPDGILRLHSLSLDKKENSSSIVWASSVNRCDPKGICRLNGYCTLYDTEPKCECPPGFDYVSPGNWTAGCKRNTNSCKNKEQWNQYSMRRLETTWWKNDPYSVFTVKLKDECETACLEDCNCEAAIFTDGECRKQRFPLRYGFRSLTYSNIAHIKWASQESQKEGPNDDKTKKKE
ncbi:putative receptor protein kinase ZmPK1 [Heracleum sosnowskyi]|uniref:Receptor protein kinase ZmPK1 n=1 Tax=Heracleum sosnowskyi TaxID=360622 RepID=A0AAD8MG44_9APIA|nr:putative receptor protein kinase ZmPK1 [Heracleum sosnowskyi]